MLERFEKPLRIVCLVLGAMVLLQVSRVALRKNPLDQLNIPQLPSISTNVVGQADAKPTNSVVVSGGEKKQTNSVAKAKDTNAVSTAKDDSKHTNVVAELKKEQTNAPVSGAPMESNQGAQAISSATAVVVELKKTNGAVELSKNQTNAVSISNEIAQAATFGTKVSTNAASTNVVALNGSKGGAPSGIPPGGMMPGGRPSSSGKKPGSLPAAIQARVDKITESELLAPVIRPAPMALFGIAGDSAFLRGPKGQTGVVKEGEEIDGIKLLKIGFNRVLVEQDGEKKELMVFSGFGGESLLPKENKETPK